MSQSLSRKLINTFYHYPKGKYKEIKLYRGFFNYYRVKMQSYFMKKHLLKNLKIPFKQTYTASFININFLSGGQYLHQTLLCIYSLFRFLTPDEKEIFKFNIYDDGTLEVKDYEKIKIDFPFVNLILFKISDEKVKALLPENKYPRINLRLQTYPIMKKLVYVHLANKGLQPILDSDMLFFQRPNLFIEWMKNAKDDSTFFVQDIFRNYGYKDEVMEKLSNGKIPDKINGGLYSFHSERVSFDEIEQNLIDLELSGGASYYVEQALIAIIASKYANHIPAPESDYIVYPTKEQVEKKTGILHHYVNVSKEHYFDFAWKHIIKKTS